MTDVKNKIKYILLGDPIAWMRPGVFRGRFYDRQKVQKISNGLLIKRIHGKHKLFDGPVELKIVFYFAIPKSRSKDTDKLLLSPMFYKPDESNLIKFYEDAANKLAYHDDCLIVKTIAYKCYSSTPRVEFSITDVDIDKFKQEVAEIWLI